MAPQAQAHTRSLQYRFKRESGETREFRVELQLPDLSLAPAAGRPPPNWACLEHCQCSHCPLNSASHPHCPIAAHLAPVVDYFKDCLSYEIVDVEIETEARSYCKTVDLQTGISSLMGLIMVTSGCPVMDKLRPMVCTHLPFASVEETLFRSISTYLMAQHLRQRRGGKPDWELKQFAAVYDNVAELNRCFKERLESIVMQDANLNALTQLDCFGVFSTLGLEEDGLDELEPVFHAYLNDGVPTVPSLETPG